MTPRCKTQAPGAADLSDPNPPRGLIAVVLDDERAAVLWQQAKKKKKRNLLEESREEDFISPSPGFPAVCWEVKSFFLSLSLSLSPLWFSDFPAEEAAAQRPMELSLPDQQFRYFFLLETQDWCVQRPRNPICKDEKSQRWRWKDATGVKSGRQLPPQ